MSGDNPVLNIESGFKKHVGYDVETGDGTATLTLDIKPFHLNRSDVLHGGVIMTVLDAACGYACTAGHDDPDYPGLVTVSMTCNFVGIVDEGRVRVEAVQTGGGRRLVFTEAKVFDEHGDVIATATGTYKRLAGRAVAKGKSA